MSYDTQSVTEFLIDEGLSSSLARDLAVRLEDLVKEASSREGGYCWLIQQIPIVQEEMIHRYEGEWITSPICIEEVIANAIRTAALGVLLLFDLPNLLEKGNFPYKVQITET